MTYSERKYVLLRDNPALQANMRKRMTLLIVKMTVLEAIVIAATVSLLTVTVSALALGAVAALAVVFFCLRSAGILRARMYGRIVAYRKEMRIVSKNKAARTMYGDIQERGFGIYTVENENGKQIDFAVEAQYICSYTVGDTVIRLPFVEYPIDLVRDDWEICPFCNNIFPKESDTCVQCGASRLELGEK